MVHELGTACLNVHMDAYASSSSEAVKADGTLSREAFTVIHERTAALLAVADTSDFTDGTSHQEFDDALTNLAALFNKGSSSSSSASSSSASSNSKDIEKVL